MPIPDDRTAFPIQRWFNETPWGQRADDLADIERRIAALETTYALESPQHGSAEASGEVAITATSIAGAIDVGGPRVTVAVPNDNSLVMVYAEFDLYVVAAGSAEVGCNIFEATAIPSGAPLVQLQDIPQSVWHDKCNAPGSHWASSAPYVSMTFDAGGAAGKSPRGARPYAITFLPSGTYTFELRWHRINATTMNIRQRKLWVDVI